MIISQRNADNEIPWLARNLKPILAVDPDFVVEIYQKCYRYTITDETSTPINNSQILPLSSSRRQDYEGSWWSLKDLFSELLVQHPRHAVRALKVSVSGYIEREHMGERNVVWHPVLHTGQALLREEWQLQLDARAFIQPPRRRCTNQALRGPLLGHERWRDQRHDRRVAR